MSRSFATALAAATLVLTAASAVAQDAATPAAARPNILVIFGDDIGISDVSAYSDGLVGYRTPNIDRIADEGMRFTDYYAENSCTAGRASFITGQSPKRTGLTKVGAPGAPVGLQARDITIAEALKPLGYATGQFGKNHLGDRDEYLPTAHGFDEFFDQAIEQGVMPTLVAGVVIGTAAKALRDMLGPDTVTEILRSFANDVEADRERFDA